MPCCKCNGSGARCRGCSCAKGKKGCIDCYPGRKGKCANASFRPTASQTSSQPLLSTLSPSCASVQASQPSLIPLLSTAPPTRRALFISPFTAATSLLTAASNCSSPHTPLVTSHYVYSFSNTESARHLFYLARASFDRSPSSKQSARVSVTHTAASITAAEFIF